MCKMLSVMCNDADLIGCAIEEVRASLKVARGSGHDGVGVGYYSSDDPLLKRRPSAPEEEIDYAELVEGIESNTLLVHVRRATTGSWKPDNIHPFRFRRWLFAHIGDLPGVERQREMLTGSLPSFLARNIRGETDSELAFHLFLDFLFRDGTLNDISLSADDLARHLRAFAQRLDELHRPEGDGSFAIAVTNGQIMGAICRRVRMHYSHREGIHACVQHEQSDTTRQVHGRFKGIMIGAEMADPGHQWREVADGSLLTVTPALELRVQQI